MTPLLALLIPYTPDRQQLVDRVIKQIEDQCFGKYPSVFTITHLDNREKTTGMKRNDLLDKAREMNATHIAFVDSDDLIGPTYIQRNWECTAGGYDCNELWGQYYENGKMLNPFHHSIIHDHWWQDKNFYYRNPNHLNCVKLSLLKDIRFKDITVGEDGNYSIDLEKSGLLKNQYPVKEVTYYYFAGGRKNHSIELEMASRRGIRI